MTSGTLSLTIERQADTLAGSVTFSNRAEEAIRIWQTGNQWGDYNLSFQIEDEVEVIGFVKRPKAYTVNRPEWVTLEPGECETRPFDLNDGSWQCDRENEVSTAQNLIAIYEVEETPMSEEFDIWTGSITSDQ